MMPSPEGYQHPPKCRSLQIVGSMQATACEPTRKFNPESWTPGKSNRSVGKSMHATKGTAVGDEVCVISFRWKCWVADPLVTTIRTGSSQCFWVQVMAHSKKNWDFDGLRDCCDTFWAGDLWGFHSTDKTARHVFTSSKPNVWAFRVFVDVRFFVSWNSYEQ